MKAVDIENCFPSITKKRALPAISRRLKQRKFKVPEIKAVTEGLKICRECTTFQTNGKIYSQNKGCGLGPPDSCSYCDIAIDDVLQEIVPQIEAELNLNMDWLCFFRDDGWVLLLDQRDLTEEILNIFNSVDEDLVFTSPQQLNQDVLDFLDVRCTLVQIKKGDLFVWQIKTTVYSKDTDNHNYLPVESEHPPQFNNKCPAILKGVSNRLVRINNTEEDLLKDLGKFAGYLIGRGYDETAVKSTFSEVASQDRSQLIAKKTDLTEPKLPVIPLVVNYHPAIPNLQDIFRKGLSLLSTLPMPLPKGTIFASFRRLPTLKEELAPADIFSRTDSAIHPQNKGYVPSGDNCSLCKGSHFSPYATSYFLPGWKFWLPGTYNCKTQLPCIYLLTCSLCDNYPYVGKTGQGQSTIKKRWANHLSHARKGASKCNISNHAFVKHKGVEPSTFLKMQILETTEDSEKLEELEEKWRWSLLTWEEFSGGFNTRHD